MKRLLLEETNETIRTKNSFKRIHLFSNYRNILTAIATKELSSIYKISKNEAPLTESDISNYIRDNFDHLNSETNKAIEQLVKEILPDDDFKTKAKKHFRYSLI